MPVPNIDTFEQDIRDEIKRKEASIGDIASASGTVSNEPVENTFKTNNSNRGLFIFAVVLLLLIIGGFSYLGYLYISQKNKDAQAAVVAQTNTETITEATTKKLTAFSPLLGSGISRFVTDVKTNGYGTVLTINDYNSVFAFVLKNETDLAKEMLAGDLKAFENSTTTPDLTFIDDTKSNQNMRYVTVASSTLFYAFIGDQYLTFASSSENILQLRGAIIK